MNNDINNIFFRLPFQVTWVILLLNCAQSSVFRLPECGKIDAQFSVVHKEKALPGSVIRQVKNVSSLQVCQVECLHTVQCQSFNFFGCSGQKECFQICELNSKEVGNSAEILEERKDWTYFETPTIHGRQKAS